MKSGMPKKAIKKAAALMEKNASAKDHIGYKEFKKAFGQFKKWARKQMKKTSTKAE